jgi:ABC-type molybdate transport system ATPase subunit
MARRAVLGADVLLLDEPLAAVDLPRRAAHRRCLDRIRDELSVPLIYVTHLPEEALTVGGLGGVDRQRPNRASGPPHERVVGS